MVLSEDISTVRARLETFELYFAWEKNPIEWIIMFVGGKERSEGLYFIAFKLEAKYS